MADSDVLAPFRARLDPRGKWGGESPADETGDTRDELPGPGDAYATVSGQRLALNLEFIWRDGGSIIVPYACLPLLWWHPPHAMIIEYRSALSLMLKGKTIEQLKRLIQDQRVTWIRECGEAEAEALPLAVTSIAILDVHPSREAKSRFNWKW
jgi:hypothetical protein